MKMSCYDCLLKWLKEPNVFLQKFQILQDDKTYTDDELEKLWEDFKEIPLNHETFGIESDFLHFPKGTSKWQVIRWFEIRYSKGLEIIALPKAVTHLSEEKVDNVFSCERSNQRKRIGKKAPNAANVQTSKKYTDSELEQLWEDFGDVPMNPETEVMAADFLHFPKGTHREEIWKWFDSKHSKGVHFLLYKGEDD